MTQICVQLVCTLMADWASHHFGLELLLSGQLTSLVLCPVIHAIAMSVSYHFQQSGFQRYLRWCSQNRAHYDGKIFLAKEVEVKWLTQAVL